MGFNRLHVPGGVPRRTHQSREWERKGGLAVEVSRAVAYETFLNRVLLMARFIQENQPVPQALMDAFETARWRCFTVLRDSPTVEFVYQSIANRPELREHVNFDETTMMWDTPAFVYDIPTPIPHADRMQPRTTAYQTLPSNPDSIITFFTPRPTLMAGAPEPNIPGGVWGQKAVLNELSDDDELSTSDNSDVERRLPYGSKIEDGGADDLSSTESESPRTRLATSALLRDALRRAGSTRRPARTPRREVLSGRVARKR
ncbi:hypothetical protein Daesc_006221 [Daldinia eschscholtzii]|uniref:Transposase n=1 Tax=Daldinia eschscholtzii TaxID=292717 RepID=A0AAX6MG64_9PEZI